MTSRRVRVSASASSPELESETRGGRSSSRRKRHVRFSFFPRGNDPAIRTVTQSRFSIGTSPRHKSHRDRRPSGDSDRYMGRTKSLNRRRVRMIIVYTVSAAVRPSVNWTRTVCPSTLNDYILTRHCLPVAFITTASRNFTKRFRQYVYARDTLDSRYFNLTNVAQLNIFVA